MSYSWTISPTTYSSKTLKSNSTSVHPMRPKLLLQPRIPSVISGYLMRGNIKTPVQEIKGKDSLTLSLSVHIYVSITKKKKKNYDWTRKRKKKKMKQDRKMVDGLKRKVKVGGEEIREEKVHWDIPARRVEKPSRSRRRGLRWHLHLNPNPSPFYHTIPRELAPATLPIHLILSSVDFDSPSSRDWAIIQGEFFYTERYTRDEVRAGQILKT